MTKNQEKQRLLIARDILNDIDPGEGQAYPLFDLELVRDDNLGTWSVWHNEAIVDVLKITRIHSARQLLDYLEELNRTVTDTPEKPGRAPEVA